MPIPKADRGGGGGVNRIMIKMVEGDTDSGVVDVTKNTTSVGGWGGVGPLPLHSAVNLSHKSISQLL